MIVQVPSACFTSGSALVFQALNSPASATDLASPFHAKRTPPAAAAVLEAAEAGAVVEAGAAAAALAAPPTTMTEFLPPKPSSAVSGAVGSVFQFPPSITNLYM